jgi:hypothetical protein
MSILSHVHGETDCILLAIQFGALFCNLLSLSLSPFVIAIGTIL